MPDPQPLVVNLDPGKHAICQCGRTDNAPFCDGSHSGSGVTPRIEEVVDIPRNIAWCVCRTSDNMPYCDGSHRQLWDDPSKPPAKPE